MSEPVLTERELNRALLARQLLLERRKLAVPTAIERLAGLQGQWPPSPYVGLWSRLVGFQRLALVRALEQRRVVKATLMRTTLHLVSARDHALIAPLLKEEWLRGLKTRVPDDELAVHLAAAAERLPAFLSEPRTRREVGEFFGPWMSEPVPGITWWLWAAVQAHAGVVHAPQSAAWQTTWTATFVTAPQIETTQHAAAHLVRRYLTAFGPATAADLRSWSGLGGPRLRPGLEALEPELRQLTDERGRRLLDLRRLPLPPAGTPAPVRFLPKWDSTLLAYEPNERTRILPADLRTAVIGKNGDVTQTFLVDGVVAGAWRVERAKGAATLRLEPFEPVPQRIRRELGDEGERLVRFVDPDATSYAVR